MKIFIFDFVEPQAVLLLTLVLVLVLLLMMRMMLLLFSHYSSPVTGEKEVESTEKCQVLYVWSLARRTAHYKRQAGKREMHTWEQERYFVMHAFGQAMLEAL